MIFHVCYHVSRETLSFVGKESAGVKGNWINIESTIIVEDSPVEKRYSLKKKQFHLELWTVSFCYNEPFRVVHRLSLAFSCLIQEKSYFRDFFCAESHLEALLIIVCTYLRIYKESKRQKDSKSESMSK